MNNDKISKLNFASKLWKFIGSFSASTFFEKRLVSHMKKKKTKFEVQRFFLKKKIKGLKLYLKSDYYSKFQKVKIY